MSNSYFLGVFDNESDIVAATRITRESGYDIHDVYTPYAVHDLPEAMGLKSSRLTWVCLMFALLGFSIAIFSQFWIAGVDWAVNVGGRPFNSLPAYLPVMFECIVLFGGLGVLFTLFVRTKLYPGKKELTIHPEVTNDRFVLAVELRDSAFDTAAITMLWEQYHVLEIRQLSEA
ncbi:MAG: DUF3341 domain-containing protein [Candidatus Latescibacteria bacterium]|mgnify:FL=1|jgi:hypothetical protein|nr:DUF3341 domain-containing protein [Candidatus Latescibacterota bacterium]MBT4138047.1 DUF3341 domain-containing protein [Candidatus Latescibacterota bacterium]MBT5832649.1 DUF3341 domain-containing protein [Candidatus Latescibacterota bacterium]